MNDCARLVCRRFWPVILLVSLIAQAADAQNVEWARTLGGPREDVSHGVSADGLGNVYISGHTANNLTGTNSGYTDGFVSKYDAAGNPLWTRQIGTNDYDYSTSVSADGLGNVYVSGNTQGNLGGASAGGADAFVSKYDDVGNLSWTRQLGSSQIDGSSSVSADRLGNVYISGVTGYSVGADPNMGFDDAFVAKYNAAGDLLWTRQLGSGLPDGSLGVSADGLGNVYMTGYSYGLTPTYAGLQDAFVSKFGPTGDLLWTRELGSSAAEAGYGVSADSLGNVFIAGYTEGSLSGPSTGKRDAFVSKYDTTGDLIWTRQLGTTENDEALSVSVDGLGNVYMVGSAFGMFGDPGPGVPLFDHSFGCKYDTFGNLIWLQKFGFGTLTDSYDVSADGLGNIYVSGDVFSFFRATYDASLAKIADAVPEPNSLALVAFIPFVRLRRRAQEKVALVGQPTRRRPLTLSLLCTGRYYRPLFEPQ